MNRKLHIISLLFILAMVASGISSTNMVSAQTGGFSDPLPIAIDVPIDQTVAAQETIYFNFTSNTLAWFEVEVTFTASSYSYIDLDLSLTPTSNTADGYYFGGTNYNSGVITAPFGNFTGSVRISVTNNENTDVPITITITGITAPEHYTFESARPATLGNSTGSAVMGIDYYFNVTLDPTKWYYFGVSLDDQTGNNYYNAYIDLYDNDNHYLENGYPDIIFGNFDGPVIAQIEFWGYTGPFTFIFTETTPLEHYDQSTAKPADLGDNTGTIRGESIGFYFSFTMESNQWYSFEVTSPSNVNYYFDVSLYPQNYANMETIYKSNAIWGGSYSGKVYAVVNSWSGFTGDFTMTISKIATPSKVIEVVYSSELKMGDIYEWSTSTTATGVFVPLVDPNSPESDPSIADGSIVKLDVIGSQRVFTPEGGYNPYVSSDVLKQQFKFTANGLPLDYYDSSYLVPVSFNHDDGTSTSLRQSIGKSFDPISDLGPSDDSSDISVSGDTITITSDLSSLYASGGGVDPELGNITKFDYTMSFDLSSGLLVSRSYDVVSDAGSVQINQKLTTPLPGSLSNPFGIDLPIVPSFFFFAVAVPLIRKRRNSENYTLHNHHTIYSNH